MAGPLKGLRVLDLSRILAGPWTSQLLADFGAEVIKVERPVTGDDTRAWGPPYLSGEQGVETRESAYFLSANRGKKSITVDISTTDGRAIIRELAAMSDVFVENYKTDDMARYGLDYGSLSRLNPQLVYCSITGFGQTGPYRSRPGYDFVIQAMGGLMSITGQPDDEGGRPMKCGVPVSDLMTAMYSTSAILGALVERTTSGKGQYIDMSLLDVQVAWLANQASNYLISGACPERMGNAHPNLAPYQTFQASDGELIIAVGNDRQFRSLCCVLGSEDLADDARFATNSARLAHRRELVERLGEMTSRHQKDSLLAQLTAAGVPAAPVRTIPEALADEHLRSRNMLRSLKNSQGLDVPFIANPVKFSRSTLEYNLPPPRLGEHTMQVLTENLGWTEADVRAARAARAI